MGIRIFLMSLSRSLCFFRRDIRDTAPLHQQAVSIYAGGRTGHQRTQILTGFNSQIGGIMGQNRMNFPHLIGKGFIQNMQVENIPLPQLLQIREHLLGSHAAVTGNDGMRILPFPSLTVGTSRVASFLSAT